MTPDLYTALQQIGLFDFQDTDTRSQFGRRLTALKSEFALNLLAAADNVVIDMRNRNAEKPADYEALFMEMRQLSRGIFAYQDFSIEWLDDKQLRVQFTFREKRFETQVAIYNFPSFNTDSPVRTANKALAEAGIEERFHNISRVDEGSAIQIGGIVFLTPQQRESILTDKLLLMPWANDEANIWKTDQLGEWIARLRSIGVLDHLSGEVIDAVRAKLLHEDLAYPIQLFYKFPGVVHSFDTECLWDLARMAETYVELVTKTCAASHGAFMAENIQITLGPSRGRGDREYVRLEFDANGQHYQHNLQYLSDWVDLNYVGLLNKAVADAGLAGRFYGIDTGDQGAMIIYLIPAQHAALKQQKFCDLYEISY